MATIGRNQAVVEFPNGLRFHGFIGWLMWLGLHLIELMGFRNRANVFVNWAWNYITYDRGSRLLARPAQGRRIQRFMSSARSVSVTKPLQTGTRRHAGFVRVFGRHRSV